MDIEKIIEQLQSVSKHPESLIGQTISMIYSLEAENKKLQTELEQVREKNAGLALALLTECAPNPDCLGDDEWRTIRSELDRMKWNIPKPRGQKDD